MGSLRYFAYGSNMLLRRLQCRVPSARVVSRGFVRGRRLTFEKVGVDGSGKCDMPRVREPERRVYGVVFEIDARERPELDNAENVGWGYRVSGVDVVVDSSCMRALTYLAIQTDRRLRPFEWYKAFVVAGAIENGLPEAWIERLQSIDASRDPDEGRRRRNQTILLGR